MCGFIGRRIQGGHFKGPTNIFTLSHLLFVFFSFVVALFKEEQSNQLNQTNQNHLFQVNCHGATPLFASAENGHPKCLELLAGRYGANVETCTKKNEMSPLFISCQKGNDECTRLLAGYCIVVNFFLFFFLID